MENKIFRQRNRFDLMSNAEKAITLAMYVLEESGASENLTNAVIKLGQARDLVYEHYRGTTNEGVDTTPLPEADKNKSLIQYIYDFAWHYGRFYHLENKEKIMKAISEIIVMPEDFLRILNNETPVKSWHQKENA